MLTSMYDLLMESACTVEDEEDPTCVAVVVMKFRFSIGRFDNSSSCLDIWPIK